MESLEGKFDTRRGKASLGQRFYESLVKKTLESLEGKFDKENLGCLYMDIKKYLGNLGIEYKLHKHPPVYTCEESEKIKVIMKGMHAKSLLVKGKSTGNFYMVIIPCEERIDRKKLKNHIEEDITFANSEELDKLLSLKPGSVSPFAIINDKNNKITIIFSRKVWESEILNFHPNINTETIELKNKEFTKYINSLKNKIIIM